ncbi:MAG: D-alanyl-D-alanine carboxypeptidase [Clostridia bacterium]|nr:D-alanyl-D-alanine carboxypeptidase [Clostridia bacterium]
MNKTKFKTTRLICCVILLMSLLTSTVFGAYVGSSYISSAGACVMDFESGEVIYHHNGYGARVPASMTKIMTLYCVYEAMSVGTIGFDTVVPITQNAFNKSRNPEFQTVPLYYGTPYTVGEMIDMVIVYSDIGSAVALAELVSGSEWAFVQLMNNKAAELGLSAWFYDCYGIANNLVSPVDMASIVRNFISKYPDILTRSSKRSVYFHGATYRTTNHLFDSYYYQGADGFKTGTTSAAGACFAATAQRDGRRMIAITMGSLSSGQRFQDATNLLNYGFSYAIANYDTVYYTDTATTVNGSEVPTFAHRGKSVIIAETLANYGFDTSFDEATRTLYLSYNKDKAVTPLDVSGYKGIEGIGAYRIAKSDIKVVVAKGETLYPIKNAFNIGGMMCIPVDCFHTMYTVGWNQESRTADVTVY